MYQEYQERYSAYTISLQGAVSVLRKPFVTSWSILFLFIKALIAMRNECMSLHTDFCNLLITDWNLFCDDITYSRCKFNIIHENTRYTWEIKIYNVKPTGDFVLPIFFLCMNSYKPSQIFVRTTLNNWYEVHHEIFIADFY